MTLPRFPLAAILALSIVLAGCASQEPPTPATAGTPGAAPTSAATPAAASPSPMATPTPARDPNLVHMVQEGDLNVFDPETLTVEAGATVTWDIVGHGHHTVDFLVPINAAGEQPKSGDVGPGETFTATFTEPGEYAYYCKYHSNKQTGMIGKIVVA